ncbi:hypothetical protein CPB84DRAFT_1794665, partial [Gymnopilus junonius]
MVENGTVCCLVVGVRSPASWRGEWLVLGMPSPIRSLGLRIWLVSIIRSRNCLAKRRVRVLRSPVVSPGRARM